MRVCTPCGGGGVCGWVCVVCRVCLQVVRAETESVRMDWLDLLVVQGILKSLLQHRSSKA